VLIGEALTGRTPTFLSRVLQGLIAGMGFLLAETILKQQAVGLGREASAVLGTVLAFMILVLLPQVRPYTDTDETRREDTGALQQTAVRAHGKRGQSTHTLNFIIVGQGRGSDFPDSPGFSGKIPSR
jgi:uncharacterized membrane protein YhiD involved in acid resistance